MVNKLKAIQSTAKPLENIRVSLVPVSPRALKNLFLTIRAFQNEVVNNDFDLNRDPKLEPRNRK